jgi:hypothetical protein
MPALQARKTAEAKRNLRKAVLIAKDVLKWLAANKLKVKQGAYLSEGLSEHYPMFLKATPETSLQKHTAKVLKRCTACALGACFLAYVDRYNQCELGDLCSALYGRFEVHYQEMLPYLWKAFTPSDLELIEAAFEMTAVHCDYRTRSTEHRYRAAVAFGCEHDTSSARLIAIMKNVVAHKGHFVPPSLKVYS